MKENQMYRQQSEIMTNKELESSNTGRRAIPCLCMSDAGHKGMHRP